MDAKRNNYNCHCEERSDVAISSTVRTNHESTD